MFLERIQVSGVVPAAKAADVVAADDADDVQPEAIGMRRYMLRFMRYAAVVTVLVCACSYLFYKPEFGISDCRFSCYARFPIGAYYICPPNNMDGKMQEL